MSTNEDSINLLAALAQRLRKDPGFMAHVLALYQQEKRIDDQALTQELRAFPEMIVRLALCKRPQAGTSFAVQVRELSDYTLIDEVALERIIRKVDRFSESTLFSRKKRAQLLLNQLVGRLAKVQHRTGSVIKGRGLITALSALLLFGGFYLWWECTKVPLSSIVADSAESATSSTKKPSKDVSDFESADKLLPSPATIQEVASPAHPSKATDQRTQELITKVSINLEEYTSLREASVEERLIKLPRSRMRLWLNMPESSSNGIYNVSILDAFSNPLLTKTAASSNGKSLKVTLDTSWLQEDMYILSLSREGEVPDYYRLFIRDLYPAPQQNRDH
jgi:hypothetical protein